MIKKISLPTYNYFILIPILSPEYPDLDIIKLHQSLFLIPHKYFLLSLLGFPFLIEKNIDLYNLTDLILIFVDLIIVVLKPLLLFPLLIFLPLHHLQVAPLIHLFHFYYLSNPFHDLQLHHLQQLLLFLFLLFFSLLFHFLISLILLVLLLLYLLKL